MTPWEDEKWNENGTLEHEWNIYLVLFPFKIGYS
nr:MAG TPA: hypothetical protein [Caudoviricetes sp.]